MEEPTRPEDIRSEVENVLRPLFGGLVVFGEEGYAYNPFSSGDDLTPEGLVFVEESLRGPARSAMDFLHDYVYGEKEPGEGEVPGWLEGFLEELHGELRLAYRVILGMTSERGRWDLVYLLEKLAPYHQDLVYDEQGRWEQAEIDNLGQKKSGEAEENEGDRAPSARPEGRAGQIVDEVMERFPALGSRIPASEFRRCAVELLIPVPELEAEAGDILAIQETAGSGTKFAITSWLPDGHYDRVVRLLEKPGAVRVNYWGEGDSPPPEILSRLHAEAKPEPAAQEAEEVQNV